MRCPPVVPADSALPIGSPLSWGCPEHPLQCKKLQETEETWRNRFRFQNFGNKQCLGQFRNVQNLEVESGFEHQSEVQWKRSTAFSTSWPISTWGDHRSCLVGLPVLFEPLTYWSKEKSPRDLRQALRPSESLEFFGNLRTRFFSQVRLAMSSLSASQIPYPCPEAGTKHLRRKAGGQSREAASPRFTNSWRQSGIASQRLSWWSALLLQIS